MLQGDTCMHLESCQGTASVELPRATAGYIMDIITVPLNIYLFIYLFIYKLEDEINITHFKTFYSQARSSVPPKIPLMNLLFES